MSLPKAIIVDIDGTLANIDHRRPLVKGDSDNWDEFYRRMSADEPNEWCKELIEKFAYKPKGPCGYRKRDYKVLLVTGREGDKANKKTTKRWLKEHSITYDELMMRPEDDLTPDEQLKKQIYEDKIKPNYNVLFVVDDRNKVVEMWRELGLPTLQCAEGDF